jgi:hypothetical protein
MRIDVGVGNLVWRIGDHQAQVGYSVARQLGGRVMSCATRIIHVEETRISVFPV